MLQQVASFCEICPRGEDGKPQQVITQMEVWVDDKSKKFIFMMTCPECGTKGFFIDTMDGLIAQISDREIGVDDKTLYTG